MVLRRKRPACNELNIHSRVRSNATTTGSHLAVIEIGMALLNLEEEDCVMITYELELRSTEHSIEVKVCGRRGAMLLRGLLAEKMVLGQSTGIFALLVFF